MKKWICTTAACIAFLSANWLLAKEEGRLSVTEDEKTLTVRHGEKAVLQYNIAVVPSPDEKKPFYARSGHIHPVYTPQGEVVTGDMCADRAHQHAVWFAWTNTQFEGHKIDFWNSQALQGRIEHVEVIGKEQSDDEARFQVRLRHLDTTGKEPKEVLHETWDVSVHAVEDVYVIDLESKQRCASDSPLKLTKYHYGAMGLRSPMAWNAPKGKFITSEGKTRANGNHTRPAWVDSAGPVEGGGKTAGITVMQHPSNFRYPQPVRLHPKLSYFCFAPMVLGDFEIKPGEEYVSRFRYVVRDGAMDKELTERLWKEFAADAAQPEESDEKPSNLRLDIAIDGSVSIDGIPVTKEDLPKRIEEWITSAKEARGRKPVTLEINAAYETPYEHVVQVISAASKGARVNRIKILPPMKD